MADVVTGTTKGGPSVPPDGQITPWSTYQRFNEITFLVQQLLAKTQTATLVEVMSCTNDGGLSPVGMVNVKPLVNQVDSAGNPTPHATIYNVPYLRMQGGTYAVILDPAEGDIGLCVFASRDISVVKTTKAQANPGSSRQYDFSDALYVGGMLNGTPSTYVQFSGAGVKIVSPTAITLQAPSIALDGAVTISQGLSVTDDVTAGPNSISLETHTHTSEAVGTPTSPPIP